MSRSVEGINREARRREYLNARHVIPTPKMIKRGVKPSRTEWASGRRDGSPGVMAVPRVRIVDNGTEVISYE